MFMISEKQHEANKKNAQHSTGPKTKEGKEAVRFNALKHGLRAEATLLPNEDAGQFEELCTGLEEQWDPQNKTERLLVEQMAVHQWKLRRLALEERRYLGHEDRYSTLPIVDLFAKLNARQENSFLRTMNELTKLQKMRQAVAPVPQKTKAPKVHGSAPEPPPAESPSPGHAYIMQPQTP